MSRPARDRIRGPPRLHRGAAPLGAQIQVFTECLGPTRAASVANHRHSAVIVGPAKLQGTDLDVPDLPAGFSYVMAALSAQGTSTISGASLLDRGYENFRAKLLAVGAKLKSLTLDPVEGPGSVRCGGLPALDRRGGPRERAAGGARCGSTTAPVCWCRSRSTPAAATGATGGTRSRTARLVARLRRVGMPLADSVRALLAGASPGPVLDAHLARLEDGLAAARRELSAVRTHP